MIDLMYDNSSLENGATDLADLCYVLLVIVRRRKYWTLMRLLFFVYRRMRFVKKDLDIA